MNQKHDPGQVLILVPMLNEQNFIKRCIDSVTGQSYKNWVMYIADNYSDESSYAIKGLSAALEPIILVILGVSVGSIVLSVITPIYGLIGSFSQ